MGKYSFSEFITHLNTRRNANVNSKSYPLEASLSITENCNLNCVHCYQKSNPTSIPIKKLKEIISELKSMGIVHLTLTGGEPLLYGNLMEIIEIIKSYHIGVTLQTNGLLITNELALNLKKIFVKGLDNIQVSIEGSCAKVNDKQRGASLDKIITGIKILKENELTVVANITPTSINENDIINTMSLCDSLHVDVFSATPLAILGKYQDELKPNYTGLIETEKSIDVNNFNGIKYGGGISGEFVNKIGIDSFRSSIKSKLKSTKGFVCEAGVDKIHISSTLDVFPCVFSQHQKVLLGNIKHNILKDIISIEMDLRHPFGKTRNLKNTKCSNCEYSGYCEGGCPGMSLFAYDDYLMPDPRCEYIPE